jgi:hypothetical protein
MRRSCRLGSLRHNVERAMPPKKPAPKGKAKAKAQPTGFMNWLGRQVGHVKGAVNTDVTKPAAKAKARGPTQAKPRAAQARPQPQPTAPPPSKVIYRDDKIEQVEHPTQPGVILRRTIIDEVIVEEEDSSQNPESRRQKKA